MVRCSICVMDSSANEFRALTTGGCNFCEEARTSRQRQASARVVELNDLTREIKLAGNGRPYDCVVGVSGGLDSSFALHTAVEMGLRPLAVHMDNGWNSSEASNNISNLVTSLDLDLFTYVTDWETQKNIQKAFIAADVIDLELVYDNSMQAVCFAAARDQNLQFILSGSNFATEGVSIPHDWSSPDNWDATNIRDIAKSFGVDVGDFPLYSNFKWLTDRFIRKIKWIPFLDYFPEYNKEIATSLLTQNYGYQPYPTKHFENVFTRFYQGHILPAKFGVDKRKPHLSSLIISGQLTREGALAMLDGDEGYTAEEVEKDRRFVLSKLSISEEEFDSYMNRPSRGHSEWKMDPVRKYLWPLLSLGNRMFRSGALH